jgi:general stress protein CsbA
MYCLELIIFVGVMSFLFGFMIGIRIETENKEKDDE